MSEPRERRTKKRDNAMNDIVANVEPLIGTTDPKGNQRIGDILVETGCLSAADVERILVAQRREGSRFGELAMRFKLVEESEVRRALSRQRGLTLGRHGIGRMGAEVLYARDVRGPQHVALQELRAQLLLRWRDGKPRALAVVGAESGVGCSYVAANLAVAFARLQQRTLLVDADMQNPRQDAIFSLTGHPGLSELLLRSSGWDVIAPVHLVDQLSVLTAGGRTDIAAELIAGRNFAALLEDLRKEYQVVIVDTTPFKGNSDAIMAVSRCDEAIIVARKDKTRIGDLQSIKTQIEDAGTRIAGLVLNAF